MRYTHTRDMLMGMVVTVLVARTIVAFFVASVFAVLAYLLARVFLMSVLVHLGLDVEVAFQVSLYSVPTITASVGAFLVWFDRDMPRRYNLLVFALALLAALLGTWVGLQYGKTVAHEPFQHGIPELANLLRGAIIGGNLPPLAFGLVRMVHLRS